MIHLFRQYFSIRKAIFILGEAVLIYFAVALASFALMRDEVSFSFLLEIAWWKILLVTVVAQFSLYFNDLYEVQPIGNTVELTTRLVQSIGMTSIVLGIIYFLWPDAMIGRWIFFVSILFVIFFLVSWRFLYAYAVKKKVFTEKTLIVVCFLMEKQYPPYPKWFGTAFARMEDAQELMPLLQQVLLAPTWMERQEFLVPAYESLASRHNALQITETPPSRVSDFFGRPFLVIDGGRFAKAIREKVEDPAVKRIAGKWLIGSIDQFSDSTDFVDESRSFRPFYE